MYTIKKFLHHFFAPNERNNYRARSIHLDFLTYYLLFAIFLSFGFKVLTAKTGSVLGFATDITVERLYQITNEVRQQNNLTPLSTNEQLNQAAQKKASDMFAKNYWSHYGPGGETPWDFILSSGYRYQLAGENLAKNYLFSQGVVDAWMNSPSHKENVLKKEYSEVGFAVVNGLLNGEETTLVVQMFGRPFDSSLTKEQSPQRQNIRVEAKENIVNSTIRGQSIISAQKRQPLGSNFIQLPFNASVIFLIFLSVSIGLDFYFAARLHFIRINGKNLAHLIFVSFILIGLLLLTKGSIL